MWIKLYKKNNKRPDGDGPDVPKQSHAKRSHGAYTSEGTGLNSIKEGDGFSDEDISVAWDIKQDTYVVTPWGNMYKGTYNIDYSDKRMVFSSGYAKEKNAPVDEDDKK